MTSGEIASRSSIKRAARAIRDYYGSRGYIRSRAEDQWSTEPDQKFLDVHFVIKEGELAYIRNVRVEGNTRTKDKVIRRELAVFPGEIYDEVKIRRSERRIRNLGFFSSVYSSPLSTEAPDKYDVLFEVEEQKTGQFVVGAGFSSVDNLLGFVELSQGNFDLRAWPHFTGGGQKLKIRAQLGTSRTDTEINFVEPWFLDRRLSLGLSGFRHDRRFLSDDYDQRNTGGSISLGKSLGGFDRIQMRYSLENIEVFDVESDASTAIMEEEGERTKSSLSVELTHDTRDSVFVPTRGNRSSFRVELAGGPLGGETDIYGLEGRLSHFWPVWFDHVINLRLWAAVVEEFGDSDRVPIFDRLFLGGARTLRGFDFRDVGPKDENGEAVGGQTGAYAIGEYTMPIVEKVRLATFYDMGMIWEDSYDVELSDLNSDVGLGIRLDLPQFPLRLDYAWPLEADEFNDKSSGRFNFLLGYVF